MKDFIDWSLDDVESSFYEDFLYTNNTQLNLFDDDGQD